VEVFEDGHLGLPGTAALAGAACMLDRDIAAFMEFTGSSLDQAVSLCTTHPARFLGLESPLSAFEPGGWADLCLFSYTPGDARLNIQLTLSRGRVLYEASLP
jgi:N-acetylglucosamine-6-phosphate deacetylase